MLALAAQFAAGLILLVLGGNGLVRGASALATRLGVPSLVIGLTVVAWSTSAPELLPAYSATMAPFVLPLTAVTLAVVAGREARRRRA